MLSLIMLILAILFIVPGIGAIIKGTITSYGNEENIRPWGIAGLLVGLVLMVFASAYTQDPGEAIVVKSFSGNVVRVDTTPGMGFTAPWNSTISFDIRNQRIEMFGGTEQNPDQGNDGTAISAPLEGSSNASVSITVRYSINSACVKDIYNLHKSQDNLRSNVLFPGIRDTVRVATAQFAPLEIKENRAKLADDINVGLTEAWKDDCTVVDNVDLGAIDLDPSTEVAIAERNTRQLAVESARADLEKANIEAEGTKVRAQAEADADQIVRCGAVSTQSTKTIAGKDIVSTVVVPKEGVACEERLNEQVLRKQYLDTLQAIGGSGNMVIVVPEGQETLLQVPQPVK